MIGMQPPQPPQQPHLRAHGRVRLRFSQITNWRTRERLLVLSMTARSGHYGLERGKETSAEEKQASKQVCMYLPCCARAECTKQSSATRKDPAMSGHNFMATQFCGGICGGLPHPELAQRGAQQPSDLPFSSCVFPSFSASSA